MTGDSADTGRRCETLEAWTRKRFPAKKVAYRWSGQDFDSKDSLAFIGRNPKDRRKNLFIATGNSWNGITYGAIVGMLLSDMILGKENEWTRLYYPSRRMVKQSSISYPERSPKPQKLGLQGALQMAERLSKGQGMVFESFSASCTHEGCTVTWNGSEGSFDCSCHGSRFSYRGKVVSSPANDDLKTVA